MMNNKIFTVIGGGTGTFSILNGLKKYSEHINAVVTMADSGGSARKERDEWGLLPNSDIRKSLIALADISSDDSLLLRQLFQYRFSNQKGISGMTFGNLFLATLTKLLKSQKKAIEKAGDLLNIKGKVLPVTMDKVNLKAVYENGSVVVGEHFIDEPQHDGRLAITKLTTHPYARATKEVIRAITQSDVLIIGPGGFYTTILANLVIGGVTKAIQKSKARKIFIMNLMTEYGQTYGFTASRFISELDRYLTADLLDFVLINNNPIPEKILKRYKKYQAQPIVNDLSSQHHFRIVETDLISTELIKRDRNDRLPRSLIRHDPDKLAAVCMKILNLI